MSATKLGLQHPHRPAHDVPPGVPAVREQEVDRAANVKRSELGLGVVAEVTAGARVTPAVAEVARLHATGSKRAANCSAVQRAYATPPTALTTQLPGLTCTAPTGVVT